MPAEDIRRAARIYAGAQAAAMYWGMGISQSTHGTDNTLTLTNLALLCGHIGRPGTGLNPLRGQNNVQGCSDTGGVPSFYTAYQPVTDPAVRAAFEAAWGVPLPAEPGLTATEMVDGILTGQVKGWYVMGENPLMSEPNLAHARHAIEHLEFFVSPGHLLQRDQRLRRRDPARGELCREGRHIHQLRPPRAARAPALPPPGQARADWEIIADLARRTIATMDEGRRTMARRCRSIVSSSIVNWTYPDPSAIWDEMRRVTPDFGGITYERLEREGGVHWPCPAPDHPGTPYLFADDFPRGRGKFWPVEYGTASELPDAEYPFILSTGRVLYHWHGGTMTRVSALDAAWPECTVEMHSRDAARLGLASGDWVDVASRRGTITARLLVTDRSPKGMIFIPFHFAEAAANVLTDNRLDPRAKIPDYKVCAVRVAAAAAAPDRPGAATPLTERGAIKDPGRRDDCGSRESDRALRVWLKVSVMAVLKAAKSA